MVSSRGNGVFRTKTRSERYQSLPKLAQSMEVSYGMAYRMRKGKRGIHERFIIGATKAFPGYKLDDLFYVSED